MDEKTTKNIPSGSEVGEIWALGGPVWINFANSRVLASKGMTDVTGSAEALIWWLGRFLRQLAHRVTSWGRPSVQRV